MLTSRRFNTLLVRRIIPPDSSVYTPGCCLLAHSGRISRVFHWRKDKASTLIRFFEKRVLFSELCEELGAYSAIPGSMWLTHFLPWTKWKHTKRFKRSFWGFQRVEGMGVTFIKSSSSCFVTKWQRLSLLMFFMIYTKYIFLVVCKARCHQLSHISLSTRRF